MKKINFYAGPSYLDSNIIQEAIEFISNNDRLSLLELSHRSKTVTDLFKETRNLVKEIMKLESNKEVLFLHGGASLQFAMVPTNINVKADAGFIDTGIWTQKAIVEAKKIRKVNIVASAASSDFNKLPNLEKLNLNNLAYLHLTSNNTIYGTQFHTFPKTDIPLVVDMSSDILSRTLDYNQFDLIFAGFQKNLGTAGACLVVINKEILDDNSSTTLSMLDYNVHIKAKSMFNTPPVFSVLMCNLTLKWIKNQGGLDAVEKKNKEKAQLLYDEIDRNSLFTTSVAKEDRSFMNICFDAINLDIEKHFLAFSEMNHIIGIKGHKLKGGFRASLYNTMPIENVQILVRCLKSFEKKYLHLLSID